MESPLSLERAVCSSNLQPTSVSFSKIFGPGVEPGTEETSTYLSTYNYRIAADEQGASLFFILEIIDTKNKS
jgi:hypothetical protein